MLLGDMKTMLACGSSSWFRDMAPVRITCHSWNDEYLIGTEGSPILLSANSSFGRRGTISSTSALWSIWIMDGIIALNDGLSEANTETISKEGCEAEGSMASVSDEDLGVIRSEADAEITLEFPSNKPDLLLLQYNCYFVARSIIALVTCHYILRAHLMTGLRWDIAIESAIFNHIFGGDWNKLATIMNVPVSAVPEGLLWDITKADAGTRSKVKRSLEVDCKKDDPPASKPQFNNYRNP